MKGTPLRSRSNKRVSELPNEHTPKLSRQYSRLKSRSLQSLETSSHPKTIERKCGYKLSTEHLGFLMEEERMRELHVIRGSDALSDYYSTFNSLFLIIYKTSKLILTHMYYNTTHELNVDRLQVLNVLMGNFQDNWTQLKISKIEMLSTNLYEMCSDEKDFQRRVEYVSRKLCTNRQKREQIQKSFLNEKLKKFWRKLGEHIKQYQKHSFVHDMFNTFSKKLCFYDIQAFICRSLATPQFKQKIQRFCAKQELDEDLNINYTFEFLLLEEFSFENQEQEKEEQKGQCQIM